MEGSNELRWSESVQRSVRVVRLRRSLPDIERLGAAEQIILWIRPPAAPHFVDAVERVVLAHCRLGSERVGEAGPWLRDERIVRVGRRRHRWQGFRHSDPVAPEPDLVAVRQHKAAIRGEQVRRAVDEHAIGAEIGQHIAAVDEGDDAVRSGQMVLGVRKHPVISGSPPDGQPSFIQGPGLTTAADRGVGRAFDLFQCENQRHGAYFPSCAISRSV